MQSPRSRSRAKSFLGATQSISTPSKRLNHLKTSTLATFNLITTSKQPCPTPRSSSTSAPAPHLLEESSWWATQQPLISSDLFTTIEIRRCIVMRSTSRGFNGNWILYSLGSIIMASDFEAPHFIWSPYVSEILRWLSWWQFGFYFVGKLEFEICMSLEASTRQVLNWTWSAFRMVETHILIYDLRLWGSWNGALWCWVDSG